jgi:hypothetical protein
MNATRRERILALGELCHYCKGDVWIYLGNKAEPGWGSEAADAVLLLLAAKRGSKPVRCAVSCSEDGRTTWKVDLLSTKVLL